MRGPAKILQAHGGDPSPRSPAEAARHVLARCRELGFALAGIAGPEPSSRSDYVKTWLAQGKHGTMAFLADELAVRLDPARILDGARSFIVVADQYARRGDRDEPAPASGRVARYARGRNYHAEIKRRLHALADELRPAYPGSEFRSCVDTAPIPERELAERAGLGWVGKHTLVINPRLGSWFLLGVIATNLMLEPTSPAGRVADACGTCTRCIEACPTKAITPYSIDASRCISYLTIERRELIPSEFHAVMGDWVFGCDVCQEVCPHNSPRPGGDVGAPHAAYAPGRGAFPLMEMLGWRDEDRRAAFRSSAMKRATLAMMKRNAVIAAGNAVAHASPGAADELRTRLAELATDESEPELVRSTARSVLARLGRPAT